MNPPIEHTIELAVNYHRGQTDKAGLPYILHLFRVASAFVLPGEDDLRTVAVLHDIVEDTDVTLEMLENRGYSPAVVAAVNAISRTELETYSEYIERVAENPLALRVKLADLHDNLDPRRVSTQAMMRDVRHLYERYEKAEKFLKARLSPSCDPPAKEKPVAGPAEPNSCSESRGNV